MTWIKLDDNAVDHPKVESLSDRAFRWWIKGLSYASRFLTDGLLPPVFWKKVPTQSRAELTGNNLWDWRDPNFEIHDYHHHQTRKEDVEYEKERNRIKAANYRAKKREEKAVTSVTGNVTGNASPKRDQPVPNPDTHNREHITENRDQTTKSAGLIVGGAEYFRLQQTHAFVGSVLRVPHKLHSELLGKSGGAHREPELQAWYGTLDEALEKSGTGTGDVFVWIRPRHQAFAVERGWIEAAPKVNGAKRDTGASIEHLEAIARGERKY